MGMFKKDEAGAEPTTSYVSSVSGDRSRSIIGKTLYIKGEIASDEEVLIEGKIEGKIKINHRVIIGKNGIVNADIEAKEVIIKGSVTGNVSCSYKIEIVPDGILRGNILSNKVVLAEGAIFKGNIDMTTGEGEISGDSAEVEEVVEAEVMEEAVEAAEEEQEEEKKKETDKKKK